VSITLKVNYFVRPKFKSLKKYLGNIDIGIASFSMFFIGIGIINVVSYFNDDEAIAIAYIALKFYMIFKGVRRIIVQTFFKELMEDSVSLKVDSFAMVAGLVFFSTLLFYPNAIISLLFSERYSSYTTTFVILGLAGFLSSFTTSSGTRLLLQKKDKAYSWNLIIAALLTVISGILFSVFMKHNPAYISISVLIGEITLSILNIKSLNEKNFITDRMKHTFPLGLLTIIFIGSKYLFGPQLYSYFFALSVYGISVLIYFKLKES
jgi:O-antigen/teichoic acid export membrane protein